MFGLALIAILIWYKNIVEVYQILIINSIMLIVLILISSNVYTRLVNIRFSVIPKYKLYRFYVLSSYPILGAALAELINLKIDTLMLGSMRGHDELGLYTASYTVYVGFTLISLSLTKVFSPVFIRLLTNDKIKARGLFIKFFCLNLLYSLIIIVFLVLFSNDIIHMLYGSQYKLSGNILMYLAFALPFINLNRLVNYSIIGAGGQKSYFNYTLIGSIINISINLWLIPIYGVIGAVIATSVTEAVVLVFGVIYLIRFFRK
jgi:PST family polysaccharide transporter